MKRKTLILTPESAELVIDSLQTNLTLLEGAFNGGDGMDDWQIEEEGRKIKIIQKLIDRLEKNS